MTNPFQVQMPGMPNLGGGQVIQDPGLGGTMAQSLAGILAQMQQQKENEFRQQQLQQQLAQQQSLSQYYQGTLGVQNRQEDRLDATAADQRGARQQVGGAQRAALGLSAQPAQPSATTQPTPGTATQSQPPGIFKQVLGGGTALGTSGMQNIFGGVDDQNLPAAVQGVQEVNALQPKEPELPVSAKEMEYVTRLAKTDPARAQFYYDNFIKKSPQTVINNIPQKGQTAFAEELGKVQAGFFKENVDKAKTSLRAFPGMNEAYALTSKSMTGFGAGAELNAARVLSALGLKPATDKVVNTQTMVKFLRENALNYLRSRDLGSGTAVSDGDRNFVEQLSGADISMNAGSIRKVIRINVGADIMKVEDSVRDLRDQAIAYPENAVQLNTQANSLEKRLSQMRSRYAEMVQAEGTAVQGLRNQLGKMPGIQLPGGP